MTDRHAHGAGNGTLSAKCESNDNDLEMKIESTAQLHDGSSRLAEPVGVPRPKRPVESVAQGSPLAKRPRDASPPVKSHMREADVGITEYIEPSIPGFPCLLKARYTDFLVNEIDMEGHCVHLEGDAIPREMRKFASEEQVDSSNTPAPALDDKKATLAQLLGEEVYVKVDALGQVAGKHSTAKGQSAVSEPIADKEVRKQVHSLVREIYASAIDSMSNTEQRIVFTALGHAKTARAREYTGASRSFQNLGGEYCYCVLYKENRDTYEVIERIAKSLRINSRSVHYAGTKDKRGCTSQRLCVHRMRLERLRGLNSLQKTGFRLGNFEYRSEPLQLGDLQGNRFCVVLRRVQADPELVSRAVQTLQRIGFINYFGMQRFGMSAGSTHEVGAVLLREEWQRAIDLILDPHERDDSDPSWSARTYYKSTGDAAGALLKMPRKCVAENAILRGLAKAPTDKLSALLMIPRNLRTMYLHAFQSYIWNVAASARFRAYGTRVVAGDLVLSRDEDRRAHGGTGEFTHARRITEADVASYTIYDVVLPLPGSDVVYPEADDESRENAPVFQAYKTEMAKFGLDPLRMQRKQREMSVVGAYRRLLQKPDDLQYRLMRYTQDDERLTVTDAELLRGDHEPYGDAHDNSAETVYGSGPHLALRIKFTLALGTYATMALREVFKEETDAVSQKANMPTINVDEATTEKDSN